LKIIVIDVIERSDANYIVGYQVTNWQLNYFQCSMNYCCHPLVNSESILPVFYWQLSF